MKKAVKETNSIVSDGADQTFTFHGRWNCTSFLCCGNQKNVNYKWETRKWAPSWPYPDVINQLLSSTSNDNQAKFLAGAGRAWRHWHVSHILRRILWLSSADFKDLKVEQNAKCKWLVSVQEDGTCQPIWKCESCHFIFFVNILRELASQSCRKKEKISVFYSRSLWTC